MKCWRDQLATAGPPSYGSPTVELARESHPVADIAFGHQAHLIGRPFWHEVRPILLENAGIVAAGDVQPLVGLALALQAIGAEAIVCAPPDPEFAELLHRTGVSLAPAFAPVQEWIETAKASGLVLPQLAAKMVPAQFDAIMAAAEGCDAIVATGLFPSVAAARAVAEKLGIRFVWVAFCPLSIPSPHHPPMAYPGWPHPPGMTDNRRCGHIMFRR